MLLLVEVLLLLLLDLFLPLFLQWFKQLQQQKQQQLQQQQQQQLQQQQQHLCLNEKLILIQFNLISIDFVFCFFFQLILHMRVLITRSDPGTKAIVTTSPVSKVCMHSPD